MIGRLGLSWIAKDTRFHVKTKKEGNMTATERKWCLECEINFVGETCPLLPGAGDAECLLREGKGC